MTQSQGDQGDRRGLLVHREIWGDREVLSVCDFANLREEKNVPGSPKTLALELHVKRGGVVLPDLPDLPVKEELVSVTSLTSL
jgi:hypothetical protein